MKGHKKRFGFSLAEILVAIAIVAVIAAVVIPSIGGQLRSGDESRVQQDLTSIRAGVEQFLATVRRYPNSVGHLTNVPTISLPALVGGNYVQGQISRWRGPYLTKDSVSALKTGFDATILTQFDTLTKEGILYLRIKIAAFDSVNALRLDQKMDDGVLSTGQIRWTIDTATADTLFYYAIPVQ